MYRISGDELKQAELQYRRAFAKADAEGQRPIKNGTPYLPDKPNSTHWDAFDDLLTDVRDAEDEWDWRMRELADGCEPKVGRAASAVTNTSNLTYIAVSGHKTPEYRRISERQKE